MKTKIYTTKGESKQDFSFPSEFKSISASLMKQALRVYEDRSHLGSNKVKTRSEINRTTKKYYKQKGTGGARHGAKSAPIFVGGGVAHGPKGIKRLLLLPSKMKKLALKGVLLSKFENKKGYIVEGLDKIKKTKDASKVIENLKLSSNTLVVLNDKNKAFNNLEDVKVSLYKNLSFLSVYRSTNLLLDINIFNKEEKKK